MVAERSADAGGCVEGPVRAIADLALQFRGFRVGLAHDDIDCAAERALAIEDRGRPAQNVDALDHPGIGGEGDRAGGREKPHAVDQLQHGALSLEAARGERGAAIAGIGDAGDADGAGLRIDDRNVAAGAKRLAVDDRDAGRVFERSEAEAAAGRVGRGQRLAPGLPRTRIVSAGSSSPLPLLRPCRCSDDGHDGQSGP